MLSTDVRHDLCTGRRGLGTSGKLILRRGFRSQSRIHKVSAPRNNKLSFRALRVHDAIDPIWQFAQFLA